MIRTTCLTSGCWVVTEVIPGARSVALGVMIEAGSQVEPDAAQGAAHLLEHLLFRGADGLEEAVLSDALDRLGGDSNAFTDKEVMTAYVRTIPERSASALDLLVRVTQRPLLDAQHIEAEQSIVLDELLARNDEGGELAQLVLDQALYPGHPLGRDVLGTPASLAAIDRAVLSSFHEAAYGADRSVVIGVGCVDHEAIVAAVSSSMGRGHATLSRPAPPRHPHVPTAALVEHDGGQSHLLIGVRAPGVGSDGYLAWLVATHALGGGVSSRLFRSVRDELALAYSVGAELSATSVVGAVSAYCATAPTNMGAVIDRIAAELDALGADGISPEEFDRSLEAVRTDLLLSADEPLARLGRLGYETLLLGGPRDLVDRIAELDAVSFDEVDDAARSLGRAVRHGVVVGPGSASLTRLLEAACRT